MIGFHCPFCQQYLEAPEGSMGRRVQCMTCDNKFELSVGHVLKLEDKVPAKQSTRRTSKRRKLSKASQKSASKAPLVLVITTIICAVVGIFYVLSSKQTDAVSSPELSVAEPKQEIHDKELSVVGDLKGEAGQSKEKPSALDQSESLELKLTPLETKYPSLPCDPRKIIGVEQKSGKEDQGVKYFEDMSFGISGDALVQDLKKYGVNSIRIPIMNQLKVDDRADVIVQYIKKIHDAGGSDLGVILSVRRYRMISKKQQDRWCEDLAYIYNALKKESLHRMVIGCSFDENGMLNDKASDKSMWDNRHQGILEAMDKLNQMTSGDFKKRTVFIHGKGLGSQFKGVKASSDAMNFPAKLKQRAANYTYSFKFYQTGFPEDKSKMGWIRFLYDHCGFQDLKEMGVSLIFVGDAGDGIKGKGFDKNTKVYGKCGPWVMHALRQVFAENNWTGFSFGVFLEEGHAKGATVLNRVKNAKISGEAKQLEAWRHWKDIVKD